MDCVVMVRRVLCLLGTVASPLVGLFLRHSLRAYLFAQCDVRNYHWKRDVCP